MKSILLFTLSICLTGPLFAQTEVFVRFSHQLGTAEFRMDSMVSSNAGYDLNVQRLEYYLDEFEIVHDGGQISPVADTWLLVRPADDSTFSLGMHNVQTIEGINFSVGIDSSVNHLDPSSYTSGHPLGHHNPPMHWGWAAGYRFVCIEGYAGPSLLFNYQIHALGDENYNDVSIVTDAVMDNGQLFINLKADYLNLLTNVDVSGGLIVHSTTDEAVTLLSNMATQVFSKADNNTAIEPGFEGSLDLSPNPAIGTEINLSYDLPAGHQYQVQIFDLSGRLVRKYSLHEMGQGNLNMASFQSGVYMLRLMQDERQVAYEKLMVLD